MLNSSRIPTTATRPYPWERPRRGQALRMAVRRWAEKLQGSRMRGTSSAHRTTFTRQLASLVSAGVPLDQALDLVGRSGWPAAWRSLLQMIRLDVTRGHTLAQALSRHPHAFPSVYVNLVEAGEASGLLEPTLLRLAEREEKAAALARQLRSAMAYPLVVVAVALCVVAVMMVQVVPTFTEVFASFGAPLPLLTRLVVQASSWVAQWGGWWLASFAGAAALLWWKVQGSAPARLSWDRLTLHLPVAGPLLHQAAMARWAYTFSAVFSAGLTLVDALAHAAQACGNSAVAQATLQAQRDVKAGQPLAESLASSGLFLPLVLQMVAIGDAAGSLDQMVASAARALEDQVDTAVKGLAGVVEPLIIVMLGVVIGTVVVAMYLPILQLGALA